MPENQENQEAKYNPKIKICDSGSCFEYINRFASYGHCYISGQTVKRFTKCILTNKQLQEANLDMDGGAHLWKQARTRIYDN